MTIEEGGPMSAREERWDRIELTTSQHVPFPDEPFHPRKVTARMRIWPRLPFTRAVRLSPVAFVPQINAIDMMGCVSMMGSMRPYLYLDPDRRLVRRTLTARGRSRYKYVTNPFFISDEDIARLEIGVQGNNDLLEAEYEKVCDAIMAEFGYLT